MGSIWDKLKPHAAAQFLDVIEWMEDDKNTVVYRFPIFNQAIQDGGKLVVREGQAACFVSEGRLSEVFGPGTYEISTRTKAIVSFFESIKYALNYPYKGDIFFVSTRQFTDLKWGTPAPVPLRDPEFGPVRIRAFGNYSFRVKDPATFLRELVGNNGLFTKDEIEGQLKRKCVSAFIDTVAESKIGVLDLAAQYMDIGEAMVGRMSSWFEGQYGVQLTDFAVQSIGLPPEVEKMLDKRSSMGILGDMGKYQQFQAANAIEGMANRPGGSNPMMDAGMGLAMGQMMGNAMGGGASHLGGGQAHAPAAAPPPPLAPTFHYNGPSGQRQGSARDIAQLVAGDRAGNHMVWSAGWANWQPWSNVPEIASLVPPAAPPPMGGAEPVYHYAGPDGSKQQLPASKIAAAVAAAPGGRHLVWKDGMPGWTPAMDVPEIASAGGPPPMPPPLDDGPPPLP